MAQEHIKTLTWKCLASDIGITRRASTTEFEGHLKAQAYCHRFGRARRSIGVSHFFRGMNPR